jgi:hypothetical protein
VVSLLPWWLSYSRTDEDSDRTIEAGAEALVVYGRVLDDGIEK